MWSPKVPSILEKLYTNPEDLESFSKADEASEVARSFHEFSEKSNLKFNINRKESYLTSTTFKQKCLWLGIYFFFNLTLTIQNKYVMSKFAYPYLLTGIHALFNCIGTLTLLINGHFQPITPNLRQCWSLLTFSVLYAVNIAVSNSSLNLVTVPVHQVVRALTPIMVAGLSMLFLNKRYSRPVYLALGCITIGVGIATYGNYGITTYGLCLTLIGAFLAAVKTLTTTSMLKGSDGFHLAPLDLLFYMSPLAVLYMLALSWYTGEAAHLHHVIMTEAGSIPIYHIVCNGVIAFGLNVVSFTANKKTGAVAISVAANIKQVLSVVLAVLIFNLKISTLNAAGIFLTLLAGAWYARIEFMAKKSQPGFITPPNSPRSFQTGSFRS